LHAAVRGGRNNGTVEGTAREQGSAWARLSDALPSVGTIVGIAAGAGVFVYSLGGAVMWLRLEQADIPPTRGLATMPRETLLVVGLGQLILPTLFAAVVLACITWVFQAVPLPGERQRLVREPSSADVSGRRAVVGLLGYLLVMVALLAFLVLLFLPVSYGRSVITVAACLLAAYIVYLQRMRRRSESGRRFPVTQVILVGAAVIALLVLALQLEKPSRLEPVRLQTSSGTVEGLLVGSTPDTVYVGRKDLIVGVPSRRIEQIKISRAAERPSDYPLLGRWLGLD
jgi:hypothetical protein